MTRTGERPAVEAAVEEASGALRPTGPRRLGRDLGPGYAANGALGVVFSASGPIAVTLAVGAAGGLTQVELASWVFGMFLSAGLATLLMALLYRQPLGFAGRSPARCCWAPPCSTCPSRRWSAPSSAAACSCSPSA